MVTKKRRGMFFFILIILVLFLSACSFYELTPTLIDETHNESASVISFQEYLWQEHPLDLIIQIGLLLAGSFGVATLLPSPDEE